MSLSAAGCYCAFCEQVFSRPAIESFALEKAKRPVPSSQMKPMPGKFDFVPKNYTDYDTTIKVYFYTCGTINPFHPCTASAPWCPCSGRIFVLHPVISKRSQPIFLRKNLLSEQRVRCGRTRSCRSVARHRGSRSGICWKCCSCRGGPEGAAQPKKSGDRTAGLFCCFLQFGQDGLDLRPPPLVLRG